MGLLSRLVRRVARRDCPWREVRGQLRPVLRTITTGTALAGPARPLHAPTVPYLAEMVVVDQPTSMAYVGSDRLTEWGVRREAVFAAARENLARRAARVGGPAADGPVMLRFVEDGESYWSSCLLLDGWLGSLADRVGGRPVAFVPDWETLIVVADEPALIGQIVDMIEADYLSAPRAISPVPYVGDSTGRTVPYDAPPGHPLHHAVRRAERMLAVREYAQQHALLAGAHAGAALAELTLNTRPDGSTFTVTTWPPDGSALLPHADFVAFSSADGDLFHVPWAEVVEHAPPVAVLGLEPTRYLVRGWPSREALSALRAAASGPP